MYVIQARNANQLLPELMRQLRDRGVERESRNGPVVQLEGPTTLLYHCPLERVVFWRERAANPFFHLMEALWMLVGRDDVAFPASILNRFREFSDDGARLNGAYGRRWRSWFKRDQLAMIAAALTANPNCRRQVLSMWDGAWDLGLQSKDLPCNTHVYFSRDVAGRLDMTVCNRSNDAVWGAVGANVVQFSVLQEFMAAWIGCPVGRYWQVSNNMHLYLDQHRDLMHQLAEKAFPSHQHRDQDPYERGLVRPYPLLAGNTIHTFLQDVDVLLSEDPTLGMRSVFLRRVALPMLRGFRAFQNGGRDIRCDLALNHLGEIPSDCDWGVAAVDWIEQRRG